MSNVIVACMRVKELPKPYVSSEKKTCSRCREDVWVHVVVLEQFRKENLVFICKECAEIFTKHFPVRGCDAS